MTGKELLWATLAVAVAAWVWHHLGIRQLALQRARQATRKEGVQLLDQSIVLARFRLRRSPDTLFAFERTYQFEFSSVGDRRFLGWVVMLGRRQEHIEFQPYTANQRLQ